MIWLPFSLNVWLDRNVGARTEWSHPCGSCSMVILELNNEFELFKIDRVRFLRPPGSTVRGRWHVFFLSCELGFVTCKIVANNVPQLLIGHSWQVLLGDGLYDPENFVLVNFTIAVVVVTLEQSHELLVFFLLLIL